MFPNICFLTSVTLFKHYSRGTYFAFLLVSFALITTECFLLETLSQQFFFVKLNIISVCELPCHLNQNNFGLKQDRRWGGDDFSKSTGEYTHTHPAVLKDFCMIPIWFVLIHCPFLIPWSVGSCSWICNNFCIITNIDTAEQDTFTLTTYCTVERKVNKCAIIISNSPKYCMFNSYCNEFSWTKLVYINNP